MDIAQIVSISLSSQEHAPYVDISKILPTASKASVEDSQAPSVDIVHINATGEKYERAQVHERVPREDIAQFLSNATEDLYETAQIYERVPDVDITQILLSSATRNKSVLINGEEKTSVYEKVPNIILVSGADTTTTSGEESTEYTNKLPIVDVAKILSSADNTPTSLPMMATTVRELASAKCGYFSTPSKCH